ncbi:NAD(P)/FAD-dependent oxidoreductase [Enterobacillus tribolii]|uniref:3-phenylpropionate/trans-cinnamate dioxygenase ferredoxin reductase subunit n=1 Tax=Enterobacillus tribolii TaxID=1487935 RepID=A0A370QGC8_9GAMM|nr:FAD-dependent oxidoreductase [Enterobacillus tribolii]MBW7981731.1 pyridine nucleotide-disulfide oxidoreductase [Enterobacillus tribolii]RDK87415.1 3-phenylpropionate/trans-cinnamate dioxygenase ferredoxin reductase subunit [Enterobacillus tribolii]
MSDTIVIIGAGQAGGWTAKTLRDKGFAGRLIVVGDEPHDFYERPPLSKAALQQEQPPFSALFSAETLAALNLEWRRPLRAEALDRAAREVVLSNGERLRYDQLVIATGGQARLPGREWQAHPRVHTLRTWDDATRLRAALSAGQKVAIVGGGWIGLEIAATARGLGKDVTLFESQARLCQRSVDPAVSQMLLEMHRAHGVTVHPGCGNVTLGGGAGQALIRSDVTPEEDFDCVVVGIGVTLNTELAQRAGLAVEQGIVVDGRGRTSDPAIFAVGDVAQHPQLGLCLQSWAYAQNQAIATATAMLDPQAPEYTDGAWLWSDQYGRNIQILGLPGAGTQTCVREQPQGALYFSLNARNRLTQLVSVNDARTVKLAKRWQSADRELDPAQLADPAFSLMSLK